ncbi:MAG: peroxide stress protein YaaA [Bacteroidia bacterium]
MIAIISPAKTLDFSASPITEATQAQFQKETQALLKILRKQKVSEIAALMSVSDKIAELNYARYQTFADDFTAENSKQALYAFKGDVYLGFELEKYQQAELDFAQKHLRILSGLYGLLCPLDYIQPYRLEMGTRLATPKGKNLYEFWGDKITKAVNEALKTSDSDILLNLASQEYFEAVQPEKVKGKVLHVHFKEERKGKLQIISFNAKKARGLMANFLIQEKITEPEALKDFCEQGYLFSEEHSTDSDWVFLKKEYQ